MQRPASATHRTRLHTIALAIVFGLLAIVVTEPQGPRVATAPQVSVESFLAVP